ncbi:YjgF-like protein [Cadophora sp. DSE1049]|nr:YjgF-like protein [Cadophora sp. DSE1049]
MARRNISSGSAFEAEIGYSRAVVTGSWILVSGTTGYDYATGVLASSIVEQTEQTLKNIEAALKEADATLEDVVRVRYILPDKKEFPLIWPVLKRVFGDVRPAATMIQAELMKDEMRIEIEVTARKEQSGDGSGGPM